MLSSCSAESFLSLMTSAGRDSSYLKLCNQWCERELYTESRAYIVNARTVD